MATIGGSVGAGPRRRTLIAAIPVAVASAAVLGSGGCGSPASSAPVLRFFTSHQAAVVTEATARIAPGPYDDPAEAGHPGAREAGVTDYIDDMLGALGALGASESGGAGSGGGAPVPAIFAGGPWSNRHTSGPDLMASFIALDPVARIAWRQRLAGWRQQYARGIATLDRLAGGDFTQASPVDQDKILASSQASTFLALLFEHTIEGMYCNPEYGGNRGQAGWKDISYPGDIQPRGYSSEEVEGSDGRDQVADTPVVADVLKFLGVV
ncbi:MAG TPA: gluconate 2-dehydrogenase subunit 3 family protein [Streptosporangiaceae bacterium]|nr:gluconate 2-dehydrogenase subunit 3 family protein [Streptosporangiaceae bacterium]